MKSWWQRWGRAFVKWALVVVILVAVGVRFSKDIAELNSAHSGELSLRYEWLAFLGRDVCVSVWAARHGFWGHFASAIRATTDVLAH